jgi:hypothetical protein
VNEMIEVFVFVSLALNLVLAGESKGDLKAVGKVRKNL